MSVSASHSWRWRTAKNGSPVFTRRRRHRRSPATPSPLRPRLERAGEFALHRRARPCAGHPRLSCSNQVVDGRDKPGHDDGWSIPPGTGLATIRPRSLLPCPLTVVDRGVPARQRRRDFLSASITSGSHRRFGGARRRYVIISTLASVETFARIRKKTRLVSVSGAACLRVGKSVWRPLRN